MFPIMAILALASAAGAIMATSDGRKVIDPEFLKQHFGAQAVTDEFVKQFNATINSDYGRNMLAQAAAQGDRVATSVASNAARAGFGPGEGQDAGSAIFARGSAESAGDSLARGVQSGIAQNALSTAADRVGSWQNAYVNSYLQKQQTPTAMQGLGDRIGQAAGVGLAIAGSQPKAAPVAKTLDATGGGGFGAPERSLDEFQQHFDRARTRGNVRKAQSLLGR
jgi:hypothetical protein